MDPYVVTHSLAGELFGDLKEWLWQQWVFLECKNVQKQRFKDNVHPSQRLSPHPYLFLSAHLLHGVIRIALIHFTLLPSLPPFPLLSYIYDWVVSVIDPHL
jgi:hypothetical protein